jgi:hypothetical protein
MIGIKLEGDDEFLELPPDASIQLKLENPILGEGDRISPGSYSLPFNIPGGKKSEKNAAKLKNPDVIENNESYQPVKADLYFTAGHDGPIPFKKGTLQAKNTEADNIKSNFIYGLSQISPDFKNARLRDVINENVVIDATAITKYIYLKRITAGNYDVTVNGVSYQSAVTSTLKDAINANADASLDTGKFVPYASVITGGATPSGLITATYLEIKLILYHTVSGTPTRTNCTDPLQELSVKPNDDAINYQAEAFDMDTYYDGFDTFFQGYLDGTYPTDKFRLPIFFNANPYDEPLKETEFVNMLDYTDNVGLLRNNANWFTTFNEPFVVKNYNSIQPFARLKWVIEQIAAYFNFPLEGDFYADSKVANRLVYNTSSLDVAQNFLGEKKFVFWKRSFNMNELVPDWTVVEFFAAIQSRWNVAIYYNEVSKKVRMQYREPVAISKTYDDITPISSPVEGNEDLRTTGFILKSARDPTDLYSIDEQVTVGTPQDTIEVKCGRLFQTNIRSSASQLKGPRVAQKFNEKFGLRVFHYRGIITSGGNTYAAADIEGPGDLYDLQTIHDLYWKYSLLFRKNWRLVRLRVSWPFRSLLSFDWELKRRFNRSNFIVKSIDVTLENNRIKDSIVELLTQK